MVLEKSIIFINFQCKKYCLTQIQNTYFAKIRATETYYIPNYWKFYEDFAELFIFEIAA